MHMRRMQVQLTDEQVAYVQAQAGSSGKPFASALRDVIDAQRATDERRRRFDDLMSVVGKYRSGVGDVAENHDEYFVQAIEERIGRR